jgi:acyl carrier protein
MCCFFSHKKHNGSTAMPDTTQTLIDELAQLITEGLNLDISPNEIDADAPLFGQGLGLDSIDILEIAMLISKRYGFALRSDDTDNTRIFSSLRHLATHIAAHRST